MVVEVSSSAKADTKSDVSLQTGARPSCGESASASHSSLSQTSIKSSGSCVSVPGFSAGDAGSIPQTFALPDLRPYPVPRGCPIPNRVFVGGIAYNTTEYELKRFFEQRYLTPVSDSKIICDRRGVSKGYGFVTFESEEAANSALTERSVYFNEKKLNIAIAIRKVNSGQFSRPASPDHIAPPAQPANSYPAAASALYQGQFQTAVVPSAAPILAPASVPITTSYIMPTAVGPAVQAVAEPGPLYYDVQPTSSTPQSTLSSSVAALFNANQLVPPQGMVISPPTYGLDYSAPTVSVPAAACSFPSATLPQEAAQPYAPVLPYSYVSPPAVPLDGNVHLGTDLYLGAGPSQPMGILPLPGQGQDLGMACQYIAPPGAPALLPPSTLAPVATMPTLPVVQTSDVAGVAVSQQVVMSSGGQHSQSYIAMPVAPHQNTLYQEAGLAPPGVSLIGSGRNGEGLLPVPPPSNVNQSLVPVATAGGVQTTQPGNTVQARDSNLAMSSPYLARHAVSRCQPQQGLSYSSASESDNSPASTKNMSSSVPVGKATSTAPITTIPKRQLAMRTTTLMRAQKLSHTDSHGHADSWAAETGGSCVSPLESSFSDLSASLSEMNSSPLHPSPSSAKLANQAAVAVPHNV